MKRAGARSLLLSVVFGTMLVFPVHAAAPKLNIEPSCRGASKIGGEVSAHFSQCMAQEDSARVELESSWSTFAPSAQRSCTTMASIVGVESYVVLLECLVMMQAGDDRVR